MKLVCFDLGGVLVRITLYVPEAARRAGLEHLEVPLVTFGELPCFLAFQAGKIQAEDYRHQLAKVLGCSESEALAVHNHIPIEPYSGTLNLIQNLHHRGIRTACLSNTNEIHWDEMLHSGRFPNVASLQLKVASHIIKLEKPSPDVYRRFEELSGASGDDILLFDDGTVNVAGARLAGWQAEWIDPEGDPAAQMVKHLEVRGIHAAADVE